ncbi:MAG: peptidylprolyl isomerase [Candidatus Omnitrophota bacterium]
MNKVLMTAVFVLGVVVLQAQPALAQEAKKAPEAVVPGQIISKGMKVKFDYTLTVDKEVVETTEGKQPLEYVHGKNMLIPGLEKELEGLKAGDVKTVMVKPEEGYGPVRTDSLREFEKSKFPKDIVPQVGMVLEMQDPQGNPYPAMVKEIKDKIVILDFNHPLAGKELKFDVKIVGVEVVKEVPVAASVPAVVPAAVPAAAPAGKK